MEGWIKLYRKVQENRFYPKNKEFTQFEAWIDLLLNANHSDQEVILGNEVYICKRGQQLRSLDTLSKRWNWSKGRVRRVLHLYQKCSMIVLKPERKTTQITICNYDIYQGERNASDTDNETRTERERNASGTQTRMNKNDLRMFNNVKNVFSEKVFSEFEKFLKNEEANKRPMTDERLNTLVEHLNSIAPTDEEKIKVIRQAVEGNYPGFRAVPKTISDSGISRPTPYIISTAIPSREEFIQHCAELGLPEEKAGSFYDDLAYNKKWKDNAGSSIKETWKEYTENIISNQNKK